MLRLALTMGDAAGVGPEIILRAFERLAPETLPVVYGDAGLLAHAQQDLHQKGVLGTCLPIRAVQGPQYSTRDAICVVPCANSFLPSESAPYPWGEAVGAFGALQRDALLRAIADAHAGLVDAIVTLPWHKARLLDAGLPPTGHTEVLQEATASPDAIMVLCGDVLRVALVTTHMPLKDVPGALTTAGILEVGRTFAKGLAEDWGITAPRIAVCGLNPHAGEGGVLGSEDIEIIAPAIAALQAEGIAAEGPFPADTIFPLVAHGRQPFDGVIAMYHDQGLGPLKTWHFSQAANVTVGMPILRTSVDHGTAYDIAGQGLASTDSFEYAYRLACSMAAARRRLRGKAAP